MLTAHGRDGDHHQRDIGLMRHIKLGWGALPTETGSNRTGQRVARAAPQWVLVAAILMGACTTKNAPASPGDLDDTPSHQSPSDKEPAAERVRDAGEIDEALQLPPDPGEAGKKTVAGIDTNSNGVRDDIERFIAAKHWPNRERIAVLFEFAKVKQSMLVATEHEAILAEAAETTLVLHCLVRTLDGDTAKAGATVREIQYAVYDTPERLLAYLRIDQQLGGQIFEAPSPDDVAATCAALGQEP